MRISDWSSDVCSSDLEIEGRNLDIVDIEQQATAAAPAKLVQEIDLAPIVPGIDQVTRGVFDQNRTKQTVLHEADFGCELVGGRTAVRDRQPDGKRKMEHATCREGG